MENSSESSTNPIPQGCGPKSQITIFVSPTTGGDFYLKVDQDITIENFKTMVSKRLKVPRDRICLLFRDKQLLDGDFLQHGILDGSKITLLPNVETGLVNQRPEVGIMQALESLNDTQVNEFLCGKAPLNLSMRLGDHVMLIQLQLSTVSGAKPQTSNTSTTIGTASTPTVKTDSTISNNLTLPPAVASSSTSTSTTQHANGTLSLLQASRNLQHTLRRLSADVFSGRDRGRKESVYSGTFSGALNPALQDPKGRPRRDVATIVHILNDLLSSVPELRRVNRKCSDEPLKANVERPNVPEVSTTCIEDQNLRTRGKLEHLRLVMGERRERRRQRKQKPYSLPQSDTDTVIA